MTLEIFGQKMKDRIQKKMGNDYEVDLDWFWENNVITHASFLFKFLLTVELSQPRRSEIASRLYPSFRSVQILLFLSDRSNLSAWSGGRPLGRGLTAPRFRGPLS